MASNIDSTQPVSESALSSAPIRANFVAAKSEIETLQTGILHTKTEIGVALVDDDEIEIYDTSTTTYKKSLLSRVWTYISSKLGSAATMTGPSGTIVGTSDSQTLTNKTLTDPIITGTIVEDVYTITDGAAFEIDPGNGSIQLITLGANRTPKGTNFAAGESVTLMVLDGSAYTLNMTDTTFGTSGVIWVGSVTALDTTKYTVFELWKIDNQVYMAFVGYA